MEKIITIDGLASSGKSTLSQKLSKKLNWPWFSTGVLYRGMAYVGWSQNWSEKDYLNFFKSSDWEIRLTASKSLFFYKNQDISSKLYQEKVDERASSFSSNPIYRKALISYQRAFYQPDKGLILEGRDCGTVLFPSAPLKIFLTAKDQTRAERRAKDRKQKTEMIFNAQKERDRRDQNRSFAPLVEPKGALCLDAGDCAPEELVNIVYQRACALFNL